MSAPQTPAPTPAPTPVASPTASAAPATPGSVPPVPPLPTMAPTSATANSVAPVANPVANPNPVAPTPNVPAAPVTAAPTPNTPSANPNMVSAPSPTATQAEPPIVAVHPPAEEAILTATPESQKEVGEEVKKAQSAHNKARLNKIVGRLRRHVSFFIVCVLMLYFNIWTFARAWQQERAGENENWFHEGLLVVTTVFVIMLFYFRLYRRSEVYVAAMAKKEAAEKAAREARLKLEEEQKKQAFMGLIKDFQSASTYEQKSTTMAKLLTVGLESNLLRQQAIDLLCDLNTWMVDHKTFLSGQNLIVWRLKASLFEQSERFQVDSATQDLSIKSVNIIEAIVKKHISEFSSGRTKTQLDLTRKTIPTLTLTAQTIPAGCVKFDESNLWQASFAETHLTGVSFVNCDLQAASFWRADLKDVDFEGANLQFSKLRTSLLEVKNLTAPQFFGSKEWELCYLSEAQKQEFFSDTEHMPPGAKSNWDSSEPRRRKLYFHLIRKEADIYNHDES